MVRCYLCNVPITRENQTKEHVILNAIGGRLTSKKLICNRCNSRFGDSCDKVLASQLSNESTLFVVKRQRGNNREVVASTDSGVIYKLGNDKDDRNSYRMKMAEINEIDNSTERILHVKAADENQMRQALQRYRSTHGICLDVDSIISHARSSVEPLPEMHFQNIVGGNEAFHSILKSAVNFFVYSGFNKELISHSIGLIQNPNSDIDNVKHYLIDGIGDDKICHLIHICTDPVRHRIYAYIEYFSVYGFIVLLSDNYKGPLISVTYRYDLDAMKDIETTLQFDVKDDIWNLADLEKEHLRKVENRANNFIQQCERRNRVKDINAFRKLFMECIIKPLESKIHKYTILEVLESEEFDDQIVRLVIDCEKILLSDKNQIQWFSLCKCLKFSYSLVRF